MHKKKEKFLIVNADDLGRNPAVNEAVKRYYVSGAITGTSLMVCGRYFHEACSMLRGLNKNETGAHLTLIGNFHPAEKDASRIKSLLNKNGTFLKGYKQFVLRYFTGAIKINEIITELRAQIEQIGREGFNITHINSHEHIHMLPGLFKITLELAKKYNIPYIRIPMEPVFVLQKRFNVKDLLRHTALKSASFISIMNSGLEKERGLCYNNFFLGHFHSGRITDDIFSFMIKNLPPGITEIALHPGTKEADLSGGAWRNLAALRNVRLITHAETQEIILR